MNLRNLRFEVDLGEDFAKVFFNEMSGLNQETEVLAYRHSDTPHFSTRKLSALTKPGLITMKNGYVGRSIDLSRWLSLIETKSIQARLIIIRLIDEHAQVMMQWTLTNAFPIKMIAQDLNSEGNEVIIDSIEIGYDQLITSVGNDKS